MSSCFGISFYLGNIFVGPCFELGWSESLRGKKKLGEKNSGKTSGFIISDLQISSQQQNDSKEWWGKPDTFVSLGNIAYRIYDNAF